MTCKPIILPLLKILKKFTEAKFQGMINNGYWYNQNFLYRKPIKTNDNTMSENQ